MIPTSDGGVVIQNAPVEVIIPPAANSGNLVWGMSIDRSNQAAIDEGYITVCLSAMRSSGEYVTSFAAPLQIRMPKPPLNGVLAFSRNNITWTVISRLVERALPDEAQDGYFVEADGRIIVFTRHLTCFGFRKPQAPLDMSIAKFDIVTGSVSRALATGGTGEDLIRYQTMSDPSVCEVTETGLIFGNSAGTCTVYATKGGGSFYLDASSPTIDIKVVDAIVPLVPLAPGVGRLALAVQLAVLAVLVAMCVLLVTLGRRRFPKEE